MPFKVLLSLSPDHLSCRNLQVSDKYQTKDVHFEIVGPLLQESPHQELYDLKDNILQEQFINPWNRKTNQ